MNFQHLVDSPIFCIFLTLGFFYLFLAIASKIGNSYVRLLINPILFTAAAIILFYTSLGLDLNTYKEHILQLSFFLPLATILMAVNVYRYRKLLKEYFWVLLLSVGAGSLLSMSLVPLLAIKVFHLETVFTIPNELRSISSAFGLAIAESADPNIGSLTLFAIVLTGVCGAIFIPIFIKIFKIDKHFVALGIATGTTCHLIGTAKLLEIHKEAASISSVALAMAGLWTLFFFQIFFL